jgi:transposase
VSYSWALPGTRKRLPYENPQGRRVNALAALVPHGPVPTLIWATAPRTLRSADLLQFLREALPPDDRPLVVVLDNGSIHVSRAVTGEREALRDAGITLYYLPPYSPRLNAIEAVFRAIKHHDLPERRYATIEALEAAVDGAFERAEARLLAKRATQLRRCA